MQNFDRDWREPYTRRPEVAINFLERAGVPKRYWQVTMEKDYPNQEMLKDQGYYLHGSTGSGKTRMLSAMVREHILSRWFMKEGLFLSATKLLHQLKSSYNRPKRTLDDEDEAEANTDVLITRYSEVELLAIDDLGRIRLTGWAMETLDYIIDERYNNCLLTFVTSQLDLAQLAKEFSEPMASRLYQMCVSVQVTGKDRRALK